MRQAIMTKYLGPTNTMGARVRATAGAGSVTVAWDHGLSVEKNHDRAAKALAKKFGWTGRLEGGGLPSGDGNVYVFVD